MVDAKRLAASIEEIDNLLHEARLALKVEQSGSPLERVNRTFNLTDRIQDRLVRLLIILEP